MELRVGKEETVEHRSFAFDLNYLERGKELAFILTLVSLKEQHSVISKQKETTCLST